MKVNKKPMNIYQKIFYIASFIFLIAAFIYLGTKNYQKQNDLKDNEAFTEEYGITTENVFVYKTAKEILETLNSGSAIVFMGFKENKWSSIYADILNDAARESNIKEIYYYNILNDRKRASQTYENIVELLTPYLKVLDDETINIYAPTLVVVKNGEILYYDDETSIIEGDKTVTSYWTNAKKNRKKEEWKNIFSSFLGEIA